MGTPPAPSCAAVKVSRPLRFAEAEVQQNYGGLEVAGSPESIGEVAETLDFKLHGAGWNEHFFEQPNVAGVVLDDQDAERLCGHCFPPSGGPRRRGPDRSLTKCAQTVTIAAKRP